MNSFIKVIWCSFTILFVQTGNSQTAIILNGTPTMVTLNGKDITKIHGEAIDFMNGFKQSPKGIFKFAPLGKNPAATSRIVNEGIAQTEVEKVVAPEKTIIVQNNAVIVKETGNSQIKTTEISRTEIKSGTYILFESKSALLITTALKDLDGYADKIKAGEASSVVLESFYRRGDRKSEELVKNRMEACKQYLELKGVPINIIATNISQSMRETEKISVTLR